MRGGSGLHEACVALLAGVVVAACSGRELRPGPPKARWAAVMARARPDSSRGRTPLRGSLAVSLSASTTASCPGRCVELTPQIRGGIAPYTVRWSDGTTSGGGTRVVCPTATTTYTAVVTDASGSGGELSRPDQQTQASVTVTVTPACAADGGTVDSGQPHEVCSQSWSLVGDNWGPSTEGAGVRVAIDGVGDLYVAATFTGTLTVAGQTFQSAEASLLVAKLDPACRVLWARAFGAPQASVRLDGVAADAAGNVIVTGNLWSDTGGPGGLVDFGSGPIGNSLNSDQAAVVFKLGPDGKGVWSHAYVASSVLDVAEDITMVDVAVDPRGNTAFLATITGGASGPPSVNFGGGTVAFSWSLVELDANGKFVFDVDASSFAGAAPFEPSLMMDSAGRIRVAGCDGSASCQPAIVALDAGGHPQWVRNVSAAAGHQNFVVVTGSRRRERRTLHGHDMGAAHGRRHAHRRAAQQGLRQRLPVVDSARRDSRADRACGFVERGMAGPARGRSLGESPLRCGVRWERGFRFGGKLTSAGLDDSIVLRFDAQGRLIGAVRSGGTADDKLFDVAADAAGDAVIAGRTFMVGGPGGARDAFFVAKLGGEAGAGAPRRDSRRCRGASGERSGEERAMTLEHGGQHLEDQSDSLEVLHVRRRDQIDLRVRGHLRGQAA